MLVTGSLNARERKSKTMNAPERATEREEDGKRKGNEWSSSDICPPPPLRYFNENSSMHVEAIWRVHPNGFVCGRDCPQSIHVHVQASALIFAMFHGNFQTNVDYFMMTIDFEN